LHRTPGILLASLNAYDLGNVARSSEASLSKDYAVNVLQSGPYHIEDTSYILSPGLVIFADIVEQNILEMVRIAKDAGRLRPHCKTHKMSEVVKLQLQHGIAKHKCATFAEAEMLADAGIEDIMLAYNPVGPHVPRCVQFAQEYPKVHFSVTADHEKPLTELNDSCVAAQIKMEVLLDVDTGLHRTGTPITSKEALRLYELLVDLPGIVPGGLHLYDGQNHQVDLVDRKAAVDVAYGDACNLAKQLDQHGWPVPRLVVGGTGSFPIFADFDDDRLELSPGTSVFHDTGYKSNFPDLDFNPASVLITRVVSRCHDDRLTLDAGNKSVASDPPFGTRLFFPDLPDAEHIIHNEEHLVLKTDQAVNYQPGDVLLGIPRHACPTSALHRTADVVRGGKVVEQWTVTARDRKINI
jgi:D-serine deaminase-like pyridoxal phosphate-dependent protein